MATAVLLTCLLVLGTYAFGVACGYAFGRAMRAVDLRELDKYRRLAIDIADAPNRERA